MMNNFVQLRLAERSDFEAIRSLIYDLDETAYAVAKAWVKPPYQSELTEARFAAWLTDRHTRMVVAVLNDGLIGFSRVEVRNNPETRTEQSHLVLYVHDMAVAANHRRNGVGTLLFEDVLALARHFNISRVQAVIPQFNEGANRFFEKLGLVPIARVIARDREN